jgi:hypothetical protein
MFLKLFKLTNRNKRRFTMPYKNPQRKKEWEIQHRVQRLARRRDLRQIKTARKAVQPKAPKVQHSGVGFLVPVVAGGALAAYNPKLAIGAGGLTLLFAAILKKNWSWGAIGALILALGIFFYWSNQDAEDVSSGRSKKLRRKYESPGRAL